MDSTTWMIRWISSWPVAWWLVVAAVAGGIVWAEGKRREKMRLAFVGEGAGCSRRPGS